MILRGAGSQGPFGDPGTQQIQDPKAALAALASVAATSAQRTLYVPQGIDYGGVFTAGHTLNRNHIQSLTFLDSSRGERCLGLIASSDSAGTLLFAKVQGDGGLSYRRSLRLPGLAHPSALRAWRELLVVACEDPAQPACLRIYRDPVEGVQVTHSDQLVLDGSHGEPTGRTRSGAAFLALTRLVSGQYFALIGGHQFGREHGWAFLYDPAAAQHFSFVAAYAKPPYTGPRVSFPAGGFGDVQNASFVTGMDGTLYLIAVETQGIRFGHGVFKIFRVDSGTKDNPIILSLLCTRNISSQGDTSFRWGSTVFVNSAGGLSALCSERGEGRMVSLYEVGAGPR
jgi:hypothetical protein